MLIIMLGVAKQTSMETRHFPLSITPNLPLLHTSSPLELMSFIVVCDSVSPFLSLSLTSLEGKWENKEHSLSVPSCHRSALFFLCSSTQRFLLCLFPPLSPNGSDCLDFGLPIQSDDSFLNFSKFNSVITYKW